MQKKTWKILEYLKVKTRTIKHWEHQGPMRHWTDYIDEDKASLLGVRNWRLPETGYKTSTMMTRVLPIL